MNNLKKILPAVCMLAASSAMAQGAFDLYAISQTDLRGTSRFMSMGGAFGALGGDLSVLNQNPGGIGVYRSSEIGLTMGGAVNDVAVDGYNTRNSKFNFNNIAYVGTFRTGKESTPTFSWGVSYTKALDFRRRYSGSLNNLSTSMTNYIADRSAGWTTGELAAVKGGYDPYYQSNAPWISILMYNSYLINPQTASNDKYDGLGGYGSGEMEVEESGQVNEYSLSFGGNVKDMVYWGATVGITDLDYSLYSYYGESLQGATVPYAYGDNVYMGTGEAAWGMQNYLRMTGTGVNFKMGVIVKPVNELRIGFAFHTPTFYNIRSNYYANTSYAFKAANIPTTATNIKGTAETNGSYEGESEFDARTPWHFMGSVAGVIGGRGIISLDYERVMYNGMRTLYNGREDTEVANNVRATFKASNIVRVGGEFKFTPQFSIRAGYSYQTSPMSNDKDADDATAGTVMSYTIDNKIQHYTAGIGYRYKAFYADLAYVRTNRQSEYHGFFGSDAPNATVNDKNNDISASVGFKF